MKTYIVRLGGEIAIKSPRVSRRIQAQLAKNLAKALERAAISHQIIRKWNRIFVHADSGGVVDVLTRVFGVQSVSPIEGECGASLEEIRQKGAELYRARSEGQTFAVRATRSGQHSFRSPEACQTLGAALNQGSGRVDLSNPELAIHLEIRDETCYFYHQVIAGPGGFPVGCGGHALCLISGGFDSAVAAHRLLARGVRLDFVFFNLAGRSYEGSVLRVTQSLHKQWIHGYQPRFFAVDFNPIAAEIRKKVRPSFHQMVLKRCFYRAAEAIQKKHPYYEAIVTGEAIGQVSSQTLSNLKALTTPTSALILRPLLTEDKDSIVKKSRQIGLYDLCAGIQEFCQLTKEKPTTSADPRVLALEEAKLGEELIDKALLEARCLDLSKLTDSELVLPYLGVNSVPKGAVLLDCRYADEYDEGHLSGAVSMPFDEGVAPYLALDKKKTYVVYCEAGVQSAMIAEEMQQKGFDAFNLTGGYRRGKGK